MLPPRPVIVVVPGSAHTASHWSSLISILQNAGYPTFTSALPSVGSLKPVTVAEEAVFVRDRMILPILDQRGFDVVLLMHSSSSVPGSAAAKGLSKPERLSQGKSTGVIGQIFVAAMLGREGQTIMDLLGGKLPPHIVLDPTTDLLTAPNPIPALYNDVPAPLAAAAAVGLMSHSNAAFTSPSPPSSWPDKAFKGRLAYVYTTNDAPIPSAGQLAKVAGSGVTWIERTLRSGHSPNLSQPEALADLVIDFTEQFLALES